MRKARPKSVSSVRKCISKGCAHLKDDWQKNGPGRLINRQKCNLTKKTPDKYHMCPLGVQ